jgi:hypothetical protein
MITQYLLGLLVILVIVAGFFFGLKRIIARKKPMSEQTPKEDLKFFGTATLGFVEAFGALFIWGGYLEAKTNVKVELVFRG